MKRRWKLGGSAARTTGVLVESPRAMAPLPALSQNVVVHERAVLEQLERQAVELRGLQAVVADRTVLEQLEHQADELRGLQAVVAQLADERAVLEQLERQASELAGLRMVDAALANERRPEQVALTGGMDEVERLHEQQLGAEQALAASRKEIERLTGRLARANGRLRHMRSELELAKAPWWRRRRVAGGAKGAGARLPA